MPKIKYEKRKENISQLQNICFREEDEIINIIFEWLKYEYFGINNFRKGLRVAV